MKRFAPLLYLVTLAFTAYSLVVVFEHGYTGFLSVAWREPWAMQMLVDLTIALCLVLGPLMKGIRTRGGSVWPLVVATLALGSIGPLWHLSIRTWRER